MNPKACVHKLTFSPQKKDSEQDREMKNQARMEPQLSSPGPTAFSLGDHWLTTSCLVCMVQVIMDASQVVCLEIRESRVVSGRFHTAGCSPGFLTMERFMETTTGKLSNHSVYKQQGL